AYLYGQLEEAAKIQDERMSLWKAYNELLAPLRDMGQIELPAIPAGCTHNAHMFYLKCRDLAERAALIKHLAAAGILAVFHYVPLHTAPAAARYAHFHGEDRHTTRESERVLRLPLFQGLAPQQVEYITEQIVLFYNL
ncbi:MAG: DegT/DnrJ/EryC1/StrS family aminotransferase, partial [Lachnospiraceae bacterium]|nr:DegT/DnrJ/EryC1/StrS family aminotransferase [Lachnospiraceae bacterium]